MTLKPNPLMLLTTLCVGFFMVIIDVTIVNVALPNIGHDLGGSMSELQWVVDGYALTFASLLLSTGNFGDRFGAKNAFIAGLILFTITSLACGLAPSFALLNLARLLQGVAAALIVPTSLSLVHTAYTARHERAKAVGIWASVGGIAAALGPVIGAVLTTWFSWRGVFLVNIPIGIVAVLMAYKYIPKISKQPTNDSFDIPGQLICIISLTALAFGLIEAGNYGWFSFQVTGSLILFALAFGVFLLIEHRSTAPMLPLVLFRSKTFSSGIALGMILNYGFYSTLFLLPFYFQQVLGYSVLQTGLAILPLLSLAGISSYLGGKSAATYGPKRPILIGQTIAMLGFLSLSLLITQEHISYLEIIIPLMVTGFGCAFNMPAATFATINAVPENRAGMASGAFNASRQVGGLLGVAVSGSIITTTSHFTHGMAITLMISTLAFLSGIIITLVFIKHIKIPHSVAENLEQPPLE